MDKYRRIVNDLINKKFTKLKGKGIVLTHFKWQIKNASAAVTYFGPFLWIVIFPKSKNYSVSSLKALLAHELSHGEIIAKMSFFGLIRFAFGWLFTKKGKVKFETSAEKYVIRKGLGKELLELTRVVEKGKTKEELRKRSRSGYLSSKQIQKYLKKKK